MTSARILGIESSCDETAAAVVESGRLVLSNVVASQVSIHRKYGGVVPELASREHLRQIVPVVQEALDHADMGFSDVDAIAVTQGPGLIGALLVGVTYGKAIALALRKPLVAVNHLAGHVYAVLLEARQEGRDTQFPAVCLIVSGGHTILYRVERTGEPPVGGEADQGLLTYSRLGGTLDDAAGEAYDKVARMLALGYPGGPLIDALAFSGNPRAIRLPEAKMKGNPLDFSFSGIKTAVLYYLRRNPDLVAEAEARRHALSEGKIGAKDMLALCSTHTLDLLASFQYSVVGTLAGHALAAAKSCGASAVLISGGVAANRALREKFQHDAPLASVEAFFPSRALSTDNAAMIAAAAWPAYIHGRLAGAELNPQASMPLGA
jgi:N6-L-threonylcarbamoyladenine synthase